MRFRTRAFLSCFVPFALLLAASFWIAQSMVQSTVHSESLASLRASQLALKEAQADIDIQSSRFLALEGQSAELKAGMESLLSDSPSKDAGTAIEGQLRRLGEQMGFDLLFVSAADGPPLAGVERGPAQSANAKAELVPLDHVLVTQPARGLLVLGDRMFKFSSAPVGGDSENFGTLSVGQYFHLPPATKPAVLLHQGEVVNFNLPNVMEVEAQAAMNGCTGRQECDFRLQGANWIAIPMQDLGAGYTLWNLRNVDEVTSRIRERLRNFFLSMEFGTLLFALLASIGSSTSIEHPVALVISQLRKAERSGVLPEEPLAVSTTTEMRELIESYTRAAVSARNAREKLQSAYVEFIGSLANALDASDRYTAGHSARVSQYAKATAAAMGLPSDYVEQVRIGAQLHDIGKIGIPDAVLRKPGRLTEKEFATVKEHTSIGRRILEGVEGLAPYLEAVELHHENWDGSGYPRGLIGEETPIDARIIHVIDAYDAMTSHRCYRLARTHQEALHELVRCAGTQFDPRVVEVFVSLRAEIFFQVAAAPGFARHLQELESAAD